MPIAFGDNRQTVATAGTAVELSSTSQRATKVTITAETDNTGIIVVGGSTVVAALATRRGIPLSAGDSVTFEKKGSESIDLIDIWIDTTVNGDGVTYVYQTEEYPN